MVLQCANSGLNGYMPPDIACAPIVDAATDATPAPTKQYVATFDTSNTGISGTVTVNDGQVIVDLDLSSEPALPGGFDTCTSAGLKYHIHGAAGLTKDELSTLCGKAYTGGHDDPWNACGSASGSAYCDSSDDKSGSLTSSCIPTSDYSPAFSTDPFSAEVGDWSGKYGVLELDANKMVKRTDSSF